MTGNRVWHGALVAVAVSLGVVLSPTGTAQTADTEFEAHPLRPADLSSPRDTLREFIQLMNAAHRLLEDDARGRGHHPSPSLGHDGLQ